METLRLVMLLLHILDFTALVGGGFFDSKPFFRTTEFLREAGQDELSFVV